MKKICSLLFRIIVSLLCLNPRMSVCYWGGVWGLRDYINKNRMNDKVTYKKLWASNLIRLATRYWESYGSYVGPSAVFDEIPMFPHGPLGIFISSGAHIGKGCTIFQQVTIGSNTLQDSNRCGYPTIEDNVYIGCGAKIIGNVHVGKNSRIGANAVVVKDVPANSVTVIRGIESIVKERELDNRFIRRDKLEFTNCIK